MYSLSYSDFSHVNDKNSHSLYAEVLKFKSKEFFLILTQNLEV